MHVVYFDFEIRDHLTAWRWKQLGYTQDSNLLILAAASNTLASAMSRVANFSQDQFTATAFPLSFN
jgi:hypothetical protein